MTIATARCSTLSSNVGIPIGRVFRPSPFGILTRRTAGARYRPDFARSSSRRRLSSRCSAYAAARCPSTPTAPSLRVRRYASRSRSRSMWCASVVSAVCGSSCASFATWWSFVEMVDEPGVSFIVPSASSMLRHRLPSTGSLGSVPPLQRYYAVLRLPAAHSVSLRCLRSTVPKSAPVSLPRRAEPARRGLGLVTRCPSGFTSEASGPPRFLGVPVAHMLRSRTPVESQRPGLLGRAMQPSAVVTASASTSTNSRGSLTQPARSLCTLRSAGYPYTTQHSVPAGGQPLPGGIQDPPGRTEGFGAPWSAPSPLSRLGLAQHNI